MNGFLEEIIESRNKAIDTVLNYIETMHSEFDRLEGIEDNTAMLKQELKQKKQELKQKDKVFKEIEEEVRSHIRFENRLKRDNIEPDLFNQGRFYVADNIKNILQESK